MSTPQNNEPADFPAEAVRQLLRICLDDEGLNVDNILTDARHKFVAKQQAVRFRQCVDYMNELLPEVQQLVLAGRPDAPQDVFRRLAGNAEALWSDACTLLEKGSFASATALAISCMEEIGKLAIAKVLIHTSMPDRRNAPNQTSVRGKDRHKRKMMVVAGTAALVNARLDSLVGIDVVERFLIAADKGHVEQDRRRALYSDCLNGTLHIPCEAVGVSESTRYVILAGECLLEVAGVDAQEFVRIKDVVEAFEKSHGYLSDP